jgi:GEVED domain/MAM domain, meprin/A5/mu/Immune inhibitor A-like, MAM domain/Ig-like domain CHU_C associated/Secretion system C-terminal sorting domain
MKKIIILVFLGFVSLLSNAQVTVFTENFETGGTNVTSSSPGTANWSISSNFYAGGSFSDSSIVVANDTAYLTTNSFNTTGNSFVVLEFNHICKINIFDAGEIEVSIDGGANWTKLDGTHYLGSSQFVNGGGKFTSNSYPTLWDPTQATTISNTWWKNDQFNISSIAGNQADVRVRFILRDGNGLGSQGYLGWFVDDIKVTMALDELIPPVINITSGPINNDTIYTTNPITIVADITDASGIDTAMLTYTINTNPAVDSLMIHTSGNSFQTIIPGISIGDSVCYYIYAEDSSLIENSTLEPTAGCNKYYAATSPPPPGCTTPVTIFPIIEDMETFTVGSPGTIGNGWTRNSASHQWYVHTGVTPDNWSTGPSGDHTSGSGIYVYTEGDVGSTGDTALFISPCIDLTVMSTPQLKFFYHMRGTSIGSLSVDIYYGGIWQEIWTKTTAQGDFWLEESIDLTYYSSITQIRFRAIKGISYSCDLAIDDILIWDVPAVNATMNALLEPASSGISGEETPVTVEIINNGSASITNIPVSYTVNAGAPVSEIISTTLFPGDTVTYTFTDSITAPSGSYDVCAYVHVTGEGFVFDDTLCTSSYGLFSSNVPFVTDFELQQYWYENSTPTSKWEYGMPAYNSTNTTHSGNFAWDINLTTIYGTYATSYLYTQLFDFSNDTSATLSFWINYYTESCCDGISLEYSVDTGATWQKLGIVGDPLGTNWYTHTVTTANGACWADNSNGWIKAEYDLSQFDSLTSLVQFRYLFGSDVSGQYDGVSIDDFAITVPVPNNTGVISIIEPLGNYTENTRLAVTIEVENFGSNTLTQIPVGYQLDGGTVVLDTIFSTLNYGDTYTFTFTDSLDFPAGYSTLCSFTRLAQDTMNFNDTLCTSLFGIGILNLPYVSDFESSADFYTSNTAGSNWEYGTPAFGVTTGAHSPVNAWDINLSALYTASASSYLFTPYLDFSATQSATLSFWMNYYTESCCDGISLEFSIDTGATWQKLGVQGDPLGVNWYTHNVTSANGDCWTDVSNGWIKAEYDLTQFDSVPIVQFRFLFGSDGSLQYDGVSIDDFSIIPAANYDFTPIEIVSPTLSSPVASKIPVTIKVKNNGLLAEDTIPVGYTLNGGSVIVDTIFSLVNPGDTVTFTFTDSITTPAGLFDVCAFTTHALDNYTFNDTICKSSTGVTTQSLPYFDNFEATSYWFGDSSPGSLWELGTPNFGVTDTAYSPVNSWDINLISGYSNDAMSFLYSPYFDFSTASDYTLEFWKNMNITADDGMYIQYTVDTGITWITLGDVGDPLGENWYNDNALGNGNPGFNGNNAPWDSSSYQLSALNFVPLVQFRFAFYSNAFTTADGISIDDINIYPPPPFEAEMAELVSPIDGCGLSNAEVVTVKIKNKGTSPINGGINVSYQVAGGALVTEAISTIINAGDSLNYAFTATIDMSVTTQDSLFNITSWVDLTGDPIQTNDTIVKNVNSGYIPVSPTVANPTIPYATSANLLATTTSPQDTIFSWFNVPIGGNALSSNNPFTTPVLYDTTIYWVEAYGGIQDTLGTTWVGGNGSNGNMFDVTALNQITIDSFACNLQTTLLETMEVYYKSGTYSGFETNSSAWTLLGSTSVVGGGSGIQTMVNIGGLTIPQGQTYALYITTTGGSSVTYTDGNGSNQNYSDANLSIQLGTGNGYPFGGINTPRVWNGSIYYSSGNGACPSNRIPDTVFVAVPATDAGVIAIDQPNTGIDLTSAETVEVSIKNFGTASISGFDVSYSVNGGSPVTETVASTINPGDTLPYTFTATEDLSTYGSYNFKAYTSLSGDGAAINDTTYKTVDCLSLVYCPSGATSASWTDIGNVTVSNINHGPTSPTLNNPTATGLYSDYSDSTNLYINMSPGLSYPISVTQISQTTWYNAALGVYIDYNRDGDFDEPNEMVFSGATTSSTSPTLSGTVNVPVTATLGYLRMRVVLEESGTPPPAACGTFLWGETEDYTIVMAPVLAQDAGVISFIDPSPVQSEGNIENIEVVVENFGTDTIYTMDIQYTYATNPTVIYNWSGILPPDSTEDVVVGSIIVLNGSNNLCSSTSLTGDSNTFNDETCINVLGLPPMLLLNDDMENGSQLTNSSTLWERGVPDGSIINSAHSPDTAWVTNLSGNYTANATATLTTPQYNFLFVSGAYLVIWHWVDAQSAADGGHVEYSSNAGSTWQHLGSIGDPNGINWYPNSGIGGPAWTNNTSSWGYSIYDLSLLDNSIQPVQFRFVFNSNTDGTLGEGWAIDDVRIHVPKFTKDAGITNIIQPSGVTSVGTQNAVTVRIKNFGTDTLTSINVEYRINTGFPPQSELWTGTLLPDSTVDFTFNNQFPGPNQNYNLCAYTQISMDPNKTNDTTCVNLTYVGIEEMADNGLILRQNMPNPAREKTIIEYYLPYKGNVRFFVTDIIGNLIYEMDENKASGNHKVLLQTNDYNAGVYFYTVEFDNRRLTMKMIIQ